MAEQQVKENVKPTAILLVHGTWGQDADFLKPESEFQRIISSRLSQHGEVIFVPIKWQGWNTLRSRSLGASVFNSQLDKLMPQIESGFVVAHSHGGAVLAEAIRRNPKTFVKMSGIVTLATPFVHASASASLERLASFVWFLSFVLIYGFSIHFLSDAAGGDPDTMAFILGYYPPILAAIAYSFDWRLSVVRRFGIWLKSSYRKMNSADIKFPELLVVSTPGDEAKIALRIVTFLISVIRSLSGGLALLGYLMPTGSTKKKAVKIIPVLVAFLYRTVLLYFTSVGLVMAILFPQIAFDLSELKNAFGATECVARSTGSILDGFSGAACALVDGVNALTKIWILVLPIFALFSLLLVASILGGILYRAIGWYGPHHLLFSKISVSELPTGTVTSLRMRQSSLRSWFGLRHSQVYLDQRTISDIAEWMASRLR